MHDWFYERDVKDPAVILHDKLISDALLNGTGPIKTEHSYSLNSDGDSLPDSPKSLQAKMDGTLLRLRIPPLSYTCFVLLTTVCYHWMNGQLTFFLQLHNDRAKSSVFYRARNARAPID